MNPRSDPDAPFSPFDTVAVKRILLQRFDLHVRRVLETRKVALNGVRIEMLDLFADAAGRAAVQMSAYVWAQKLQDETVALSVSYPSTWWQAFKERFFPARALRRWPVKKTTVSRAHRFRTLALFPGYRYESPSDRLGEPHVISIVDPVGAL